MSMELKDSCEKDLKKRNINPSSLFQTVKNSMNGFYCYAREGKSIIIYLFGVIIEIAMGFVYRINGLEWILIICILGIILSVELLNTAIESVCDSVTKEYNPNIKIAKDCGSAATFIIFMVALLLNIIIFLPKIIQLLQVNI